MSPERKRLYAIIIITLFSFIIVVGIGNFRAKQLAVSLAGDRVTNAVANAAKSLDGGKVQEIVHTMDEQHPYYGEMRNSLLSFKNEHKLENIYIFYKDEQKAQWFYVIDTREQTDPAHNPLGKVEKRVSAAVEKTIRGKPVQDEYHVTSSGTFVSSYQEIKNSQGETFAVLGGDIDAQELTGFLYLTRYAQMGILALSLLLMGVIVFLSTKKRA
jgi:hypothetical protein